MAIELITFGRTEVRRDGRIVRIPTVKHLALLVYLARTAGRDVSRQRMAGLLWSAGSPKAKKSLNQGIYDLRKRLGLRLETTTVSLRLDRGRVRADFDRLEVQVRDHDWEAAIDTYAGTFFEAMADCGTLQFERWVDEQRTYHHALGVRALDRHCARLAGERCWNLVVHACQAWLRRFPLDPTGMRHLLGALVESGRWEEARMYARLLERTGNAWLIDGDLLA